LCPKDCGENVEYLWLNLGEEEDEIYEEDLSIEKDS
jgi:hypothetical protein